MAICELNDLVDFIETGAAPISSTDMQRLSNVLPQSRLYNTYGGTEIGCVCTYQFNDGKYMEGCIGRPMRNASIEISSEGSFIISGKTIMSGYVADEQHTADILRNGKIYADDMGYLDDLGLIHITGRRDDIINVGGYKVDPVEVENTVISLPEIRDCICIADKHPVIGTSLKLLYVVEENKTIDKRTIALHIKSCLESYKVPLAYEQVPAIRVTYNGKKDRKSYK